MRQKILFKLQISGLKNWDKWFHGKFIEVEIQNQKGFRTIVDPIAIAQREGGANTLFSQSHSL